MYTVDENGKLEIYEIPLGEISSMERLQEGSIILETLIAPEKYGEALIPERNYANMPNVRFIHTKTGLEKLAKKVNLNIATISSSCKTTTEEQRTTLWMPFKSLSDGLNVETDLTIEGLPRPERVFFTLTKNNS